MLCLELAAVRDTIDGGINADVRPGAASNAR
jgi:hypothetical protein